MVRTVGYRAARDRGTRVLQRVTERERQRERDYDKKMI